MLVRTQNGKKENKMTNLERIIFTWIIKRILNRMDGHDRGLYPVYKIIYTECKARFYEDNRASVESMLVEKQALVIRHVNTIEDMGMACENNQ